jgi:hypothetical protein
MKRAGMILGGVDIVAVQADAGPRTSLILAMSVSFSKILAHVNDPLRPPPERPSPESSGWSGPGTPGRPPRIAVGGRGAALVALHRSGLHRQAIEPPQNRSPLETRLAEDAVETLVFGGFFDAAELGTTSAGCPPPPGVPHEAGALAAGRRAAVVQSR